MADNYVKAAEREAEIRRKLEQLAACGIVANDQLDFADFAEYAGDEYRESQESPFLVHYLGWESLDADGVTPVCRCDQLYSFSPLVTAGSDYENLIHNLALLASDDLELVDATAELVYDNPIEDYDPMFIRGQTVDAKGVVKEVKAAIYKARRAQLAAGAATVRIRIAGNGQLAALVFQQRTDRVDYCAFNCLAALVRLTTDERRYFLVNSRADTWTMGYLPEEQIQQLAALGVALTRINGRFPLPVYTVTALEPE